MFGRGTRRTSLIQFIVKSPVTSRARIHDTICIPSSSSKGGSRKVMFQNVSNFKPNSSRLRRGGGGGRGGGVGVGVGVGWGWGGGGGRGGGGGGGGRVRAHSPARIPSHLDMKFDKATWLFAAVFAC